MQKATREDVRQGVGLSQKVFKGRTSFPPFLLSLLYKRRRPALLIESFGCLVGHRSYYSNPAIEAMSVGAQKLLAGSGLVRCRSKVGQGITTVCCITLNLFGFDVGVVTTGAFADQVQQQRRHQRFL